MNKKWLLPLCLFLFVPSTRVHATAFGAFYNNATSADLKPFALDLGGIIGGADFHSGRVLGFPGFDVGASGTMQFRPDSNDLILRNSGVHAFGLPMLQGEIGLPLNFDAVVRGAGYEGTRLLGGGIRYGVHKSGELSLLPDISVSFFGDHLHQTFFDATHYSGDAVASYGLPFIKPYVGVGYDYTSLSVGSAAVPGLSGAGATARGSRFTAGADLTPLPFLYVYGAYTVLHGISGANAGLGIHF